MGYPRKKHSTGVALMSVEFGQAHKYVPMNLCQILRSEFFNSISMLKTKVILLKLIRIYKVFKFIYNKNKSTKRNF